MAFIKSMQRYEIIFEKAIRFFLIDETANLLYFFLLLKKGAVRI